MEPDAWSKSCSDCDLALYSVLDWSARIGVAWSVRLVLVTIRAAEF